MVQANRRMADYEALLTQEDSIKRVERLRSDIERIGGTLRVERVSKPGSGERPSALVTLSLPDPFTPGEFFPGLPFFAV